jgi:hypothetical protein
MSAAPHHAQPQSRSSRGGGGGRSGGGGGRSGGGVTFNARQPARVGS